MNLRHGIPEKQYFLFSVNSIEYVVSLVSLDKAFILCNCFYNYCTVFNSYICR